VMKRIRACVIVSFIISFVLAHGASRLQLHTKERFFQQEQPKKRLRHKKGQPLRILFVVESFPHSDQPFILDQIAGVMDRGHEVYIAARSEIKNNIPDIVHQYDLMERTLFFGTSNPLKLLQDNSRMPHINRFDIICCQFGNIGADLIRFKQGVSGIPAKLVTCWRGATKEATMRPYEYAALFKQGDLFLPVCEFLKNNIMSLGCDPHKIQVLYVGIDYDHYLCEREIQKDRVIADNRMNDNAITDTSCNCMSVCRLVEKKGIEYAIRAVASVVKICPNIRYTIIGDGPLKKQLKSVVKQLNMEAHIAFIGNQPHEKISELLRTADIFLSPSVTTAEGNCEGIANAVKEAMASGVLVIATDHAGTSELIDDEVSGFLVPERDSNALAEKIHYLIAHPEIWDTVRIHGRQVVQERFCLSQSIDQFIAIIDEICIQ
jgi:colanic acid/amylovoran biosynthesis glycosyltransferase